MACPRCRRRRIRWPWLWPIAIAFTALHFYCFWAEWQDAVYYLAPLVGSFWAGCCCGSQDCGPCCRDRGCISEEVEARITGVVQGSFGLTCSGGCPDHFIDFETMTADSAPGAEVCAWSQNRTCTEGMVEYGTTAGVTLLFAQQRFECTGSIVPTPGECWLTMLVTGNSTTSGQPNSGAWLAIFEGQILGPYPADCEGSHSLAFKCVDGFPPCDFTGATAAVTFAFNAACEATDTFDPWEDDVNLEIESSCGTIDGTTVVMKNVSTSKTQRWKKENVKVDGVLDFTATLEWSHTACNYVLILDGTANEVTSCRLIGDVQSLDAPRACEPFELLFEGFGIQNDPDNGPCPCGDPAGFNVRITE